MSEAPHAPSAPEAKKPVVTPVRTPVVTPVRVVIALCLFAPFVAMLWVGSYAKTDPVLHRHPVLLLVPDGLGVPLHGAHGIAYQLWQRDQRARQGGAGK